LNANISVFLSFVIPKKAIKAGLITGKPQQQVKNNLYLAN
jgi:hypothetical protein